MEPEAVRSQVSLRNLIVRSVMGEDDTSVGSASVTLGGPERGVTVTRGGPW